MLVVKAGLEPAFVNLKHYAINIMFFFDLVGINKIYWNSALHSAT